MNTVQDLYNEILFRINYLSFQYASIPDGQALVKHLKERNMEEVNFLIEVKKSLSEIAKNNPPVS